MSFDLASADFPALGPVAAGGISLPHADPTEFLPQSGLLNLDTRPADPDDALENEVVIVALVEGLSAGLAMVVRFHRHVAPRVGAWVTATPAASPVVSALVIGQVAGEY